MLGATAATGAATTIVRSWQPLIRRKGLGIEGPAPSFRSQTQETAERRSARCEETRMGEPAMSKPLISIVAFLNFAFWASALPLAAQSPAGGKDAAANATPAGDSTSAQTESTSPIQNAKSLVLTQAFDGNSSSQGQQMQTTTTVGYNFSNRFGMDVGAPYMLIINDTRQGARTHYGIGDLSSDLRLTFDNPLFNFSTIATGTAPTGDKRTGLGAGQPTWDWTNNFDRDISRFTPFVTAGIGDSLSSVPTRHHHPHFRRSFNSIGKLAHFEAGSDLNIWKAFSLSASAYDISPWGSQTVISRLIPQGTAGAVKKGGAALTRDHGFNGAFNLDPTPFLDLSIGYSRSIPQRLDMITFSTTFDIAKVFRATRVP